MIEMSHANESANLVKYSAIYRCPDEITNLTISVKIAEIDASHSTPQWQQQIFPWQRKIFSKWERELYADEKNCLTDLEKKYHNDVMKLPETDAKLDLYSYVEDDDFGASDYKPIDEADVDDVAEFDWTKSLEAAMRKPTRYARDWSSMFIMADLGEYIENTWIKNEKILCTVKYDENDKILQIYPDFTKSQPYKIKIETINSTRIFHYYIENASEITPEEYTYKENELIQKVINNRLSLRKQLLDVNFAKPAKNKLRVYLFCEILSTQQFEYDTIFVQYFIDLPSNWSCDSPETLQGVTQTCHVQNEEGVAHFCHVFDITLDYNIEILEKSSIPPNPYIYFEIISRDTWNRFRTEGLTYKNLPVGKPGNYRYELQCFRLIPDKVSGQLRRFFIGDCRNYSDLTWIGLPRDYDRPVLNKYGTNTVGTGILSLRINVVHQSQAFLEQFGDNNRNRTDIFEKLNASSLVKSVEQVLMAFKKARKNMIEARNKL